MNVIEASGLSKRFGGIEAVDGLDLEVEEGEVFGPLGPNGAGKTTTIRIITGQTAPNSGRTLILRLRCRQGAGGGQEAHRPRPGGVEHLRRA